MPKPARLLAFAQLLRLPNVFTAFADIALAGCATGLLWERPGVFLLLCAASGCLYLGGMVWNDVFDRREDAATRPFRPLPSGRVLARTAVVLGTVLTATGVALTAAPEWEHYSKANPSRVNGDATTLAVVLAFLIILYDAWAKRTPAGPLFMGLCRSFNILLGLSGGSYDRLTDETGIHLAAVTGVYIVGVTWFARTEEGRSRPRHLLAAAAVIGLSLVLALVLRSRLPADSGTPLFPYLLVAFGFFVGLPIAGLSKNPGPKEVQAAVKRCVLGLVALDAVLATLFVGLPGLLILLLLPPALLLGKWVYST